MMLFPSHLFPTQYLYLFCSSSSSLAPANTSPPIPMKIVRAIHRIGFSSSHPSSSYLPSVGSPPTTTEVQLDIHHLTINVLCSYKHQSITFEQASLIYPCAQEVRENVTPRSVSSPCAPSSLS